MGKYLLKCMFIAFHFIFSYLFYFRVKFIKNKPVRDLVGDQYLKLFMAEEDKLLTITLSDNIEGNTSSSYLDEIKQLFQKV